MKISSKIGLSFFAFLFLIIVNSIVSFWVQRNISESYSDLTDQTMPVIHSLETIQVSAMKVFGITNEILFLYNEQELQGRDIGFTKEEELGELQEGFDLFDASYEEYVTLVNAYFPEETKFVVDIKYYWEAFSSASDTLVNAKLAGVSAEDVIRDKDVLEIAQKNLFDTITAALDAESDEATMRQSNIASSRRLSWIINGIILFISVLFSVLIPMWLVYSVVRPLRRLSEVAQKVAIHDFTEKTDIQSADEFGAFSGVFDNMIISLSQSSMSIADLDKKVKARTKALEDKNSELERFNKLVVGRELQLAEQKKEIARLKALVEEKK